MILARYTDDVRRRHRAIGVIVLAILAGLPVAGTVCALLCNPAAGTRNGDGTGSAHHGAGASCREASSSAAGVQILSASHHDCGSHEGTLALVLSTAAAARADWDFVPPPARTVAHARFASYPSFEPEATYSVPPGTCPPATPLVLRV